MRLLIDVGGCIRILGGWLECFCSSYNGSSLGFLYGLCFSVVRSKVTSRKFTTCKFASAAVVRPNCSKIMWNSFRVLSTKRADLCFVIAKPSS